MSPRAPAFPRRPRRSLPSGAFAALAVAPVLLFCGGAAGPAAADELAAHERRPKGPPFPYEQEPVFLIPERSGFLGGIPEAPEAPQQPSDGRQEIEKRKPAREPTPRERAEKSCLSAILETYLGNHEQARKDLAAVFASAALTEAEKSACRDSAARIAAEKRSGEGR